MSKRKYTLEQVIASNRHHGYHFFDDASMRWFNSRIESDVFPNRTFVTSEKDDGFIGPGGRRYAAWDGKRRYTVRFFVARTGVIETASEFGQFATAAAARKWAQAYTPKTANN